MQNCILSETLFHSKHPDGPHSMGILIGDDSNRISLHGNLLAHCNGRNPQIAGGNLIDVRNNVIYNWGDYAALFKSPGNRINFVANYYKAGPNTDLTWTPTAIKLHDDVGGMRLFIEDNIDPVCPNGDEDNWDMLVWMSDLPVKDRSMRLHQVLHHPRVTTEAADTVYVDVLVNAGATRPERDAIDARIVGDVQNGTGLIIDSPTDVNDWIDLWKKTPPTDTDHDGMPDSWERSHRLDPADPADGAEDRDRDGYTNVEEYLDTLAG